MFDSLDGLMDFLTEKGMKIKDNAKIVLIGMTIIVGLMALFSGLVKDSERQDVLDGYYKPLPTKLIDRTKATYSLITLIDGIICVEGITESGGVDLDCDFTEYHKIQDLNLKGLD